MRPPGAQTQFAFRKPSKVLIAIMAANVIAYVMELVLLRANVSFVKELPLSPLGVFDELELWQPFTYMWIHAPEQPTHLFLNMLWLWWMGAELEQWWGSRRFIVAYVIFGLGGAALTLIVGLLSRTSALEPLLADFWAKPHLGASGAVMGITVAWGITFADRTINILFLPQMKGRTFLWVMIAVELITALSLEHVSSTSHFGGMLAALVVCKGWWRPSRWTEGLKRMELRRRRKKIEAELRVIDGAKGPPRKNGKGNTEWN
jgi:membrane associated rhomboid family serine protease